MYICTYVCTFSPCHFQSFSSSYCPQIILMLCCATWRNKAWLIRSLSGFWTSAGMPTRSFHWPGEWWFQVKCYCFVFFFSSVLLLILCFLSLICIRPQTKRDSKVLVSWTFICRCFCHSLWPFKGMNLKEEHFSCLGTRLIYMAKEQIPVLHLIPNAALFYPACKFALI